MMNSLPRAVCTVGYASMCLLAMHVNGQTVRFVDASLSTGANNGTSWANAFRGPLALQSALAAAVVGNEIWVADGTYVPAPAGAGPTATFQLKEGVKLLGGFVGGESNSAQRDAHTNVCVLSGDLDGPANSFPIDQSHHVVTATGLTAASVIDGFTIMLGRGGDIELAAYGGGMLVARGAPTIRNCTFIDNEASYGGGLALIQSLSLVDSCTFGPNTAPLGAGLVNLSSEPLIVHCTFAGDFLNSGGNSGLGIYSGSQSGGAAPSITIDDCTFSIHPQEFSCPAGIALATENGSQTTIRNSRFIGNTSCGSGAMQVEGVVDIDRCVFIGNEGRFDGGAAIHSFHGDITVANSLFAGNDRLGFSTIFIGGRLRMSNCTLTDNGSDVPVPGSSVHFLIVSQSGDGDAEAVIVSFGPGAARFDDCLVQSWGALPGAVNGANSFAANPFFASVPGADGLPGTEDNDYRLASGSPAIDRGNNSLLPPAFLLDLAMNPRRRNSTSMPDFAPATAPEIDIGAYEFVPTCPCDLNADGVVDDADFVLFASAYDTLIMPGPFHDADLTGDGLCDDADFVLFANSYDALLCP
ncbi:MAG: hypothetical protein ACREJD_14225 [Phycisphaerales bacterium]